MEAKEEGEARGEEGGSRTEATYVDVEEERNERGESGDCEHGVRAWSREVLSLDFWWGGMNS